MKIAVIGVGLIGGSLALKLREKKFANQFIGIDKSEIHLQEALEIGIIDKVENLENGVKNAELIIVAIPVDATVKVLPQILDLITDKQTVMDVGSTKSGIVAAIKNHPKRNRYVAFHPMWGTENSGPKSAQKESFSGRAAVICDQEDSAKDALELVKKIAETLEMNTIFMRSEAHDIHTAYISHISHITSYALANKKKEKEREEDTIFQLASSGFSSTVRLAKSHP